MKRRIERKSDRGRHRNVAEKLKRVGKKGREMEERRRSKR